jgi:hypothetical protein
MVLSRCTGRRPWHAVVALLKDIDKTLTQDPIGALQYGTYRIVSSSVTAQ